MISLRALNRATLDRQMLLARSSRPALDVIEHLGGMQGQAPLAPYVGLWSRRQDFAADELVELLSSRRVVRASAMRATVHLLSADDFCWLRPLVQPVLAGGFWASEFGKNLAGLAIDEVLALGRALIEEQPRARRELSAALAARWPDRDPYSLAYSITYLEPVVQVLPRGLWRQNGPAAWTTGPVWLDRPLDASPSVDALVLRYLGAFGPATVKDVQVWCGLTRLREVVDRQRANLVVLQGDDGAELFDLPDAPRPDEGTPAPVRFLPEYDNLLLSHGDRSRVIPDRRRVPLPPGNGAAYGTFLVDGFWHGTWKIARTANAATLDLTPFAPLTSSDEEALTAEGAALLAFTDPDATHDIRVIPEG
jgi:hypothetical protein